MRTLFTALLLLIVQPVFAEIYREIKPYTTLADLKSMFPGATFEILNVAWAKEGEALYKVSGVGLPGSMRIKMNDSAVLWQKLIASMSEAPVDEGLKKFATSTDETISVEWVRWIPDVAIHIDRLVSKYGPPENSRVSGDDFSTSKTWDSKGVSALLLDEGKFVVQIDFTFTIDEICNEARKRSYTHVVSAICTKPRSTGASGSLPRKEQLLGIAGQTRVPQFQSYHVSNFYIGKPAQVVLSTADERNFRTRLREASKQPANFAGEYVLTTWGCGTTCTQGAAVSLKTGRVVFLPGYICCWHGDGERLDFRINSRLLVAAGLINEEGEHGFHFYEFTGREFKHLKTIPVVRNDP